MMRQSRSSKLGAAWLALPVALFGALSGCGESAPPEFVSSQRTEELERPAKTYVQNAVVENFGSPTSSVAWLKLPVDFGVATGEVVEAGDDMSNLVTVKWSSPEIEERMKTADLGGAGLLWESGAYSGGATSGSGKRTAPVDFEVRHYEKETHELYLNALLDEGAKAGDRFTVVGTNLQDGRRLYMQHCVHCHGVTGDGKGPTAKYLNPLPRDYRLGVFKFTSTKAQDRASRGDLHRIIKYGIPGTYMPSFLLMKQNEMESITEYIRWLAMRGEFEKRLTDEFYGDYSQKTVDERLKKGEKRSEIFEALNDKGFAEEFAGTVEETADSMAGTWTRADAPESVVVPKTPRTDPHKDAESIARGRKLYLSDKTKCVSCHGPAGRGDGPQTTDFQKDKAGVEYAKPGLHDDWGNQLRPRDLTSGIYRGGRRPVDIYRRLSAGIKGTPMPQFATALSEAEIWDLVNYVMSVPFDGKAPPTPSAGEGRSDKVAASEEK